MTNKIIKIALAVLFFLCLLQMPYGYFQLVRFSALLGFSILAYLAFQKHRIVEMIVHIGLAILFQPLVKIALGREVWNIVDVIVGIGLLGSLLYDWKRMV